MDRSPAAQLDELVQAGADRFAETFFATMKFMSQGGRTPGLKLPDKEKIKAFYSNTNDAYWQQLNAVDPAGAQSQLDQWSKADG